MEVKLLLDANLSWRSVAVLKNHFDDCVHIDSTELLVPAKDTAIWKYAGQNNLVIVTNDDDFFNLYAVKGFPPKVIMLRTGNQSRQFIEQTLINFRLYIYDFVESSDRGILEIV